jgi:two-component system chemotaxis response regulator CheY
MNAPKQKKSCLVVDDSRVVRKVARRIAEEMGFACAEAEDGTQAYDHCSSDMPDVILLDWNMPVMNGMDFLGQLRKMDNGKHPKVVFCTIENTLANIQKALQAGADEFIMKPFDSEIIQSKFAIIGVLQKN